MKAYSFVPQDFYKAPSAIEVINIPAEISGVEVLNSHQPAVKISGKKALVKVSGLYVKGTRLIPGFQYP